MLKLIALLLLLLQAALPSSAAAAAATFKSPVVLIPGDGGTQLWVQLTNTKNHWYCETSTSSPTLAWLELADLVYPAVNCLVYNIKLMFNKMTGLTTDNDGVKAIIRGFGDTETVEWLSNVKIGPTGYYNEVVNNLVTNFGYRRGVDVHGAPFDFRKAPNEMGDYFVQLKALIESTYERNGKKRVLLVSHSLGCKVALHFLHRQPQAWKQKYVKQLIAAAGPFSGAASSLQAAISGYNLHLSFIKPIWVRESQRTWPSTYYLVPSAPAFNESQPIVIRPSRSYTLSKQDLLNLFNDIQYPEGYSQFLLLKNLTQQTRAPGVPTLCVFGHGIQTARQFKWANEADFPDKPPEIAYGDGDGTVNIASLDICLAWQKQQSQAVTSLPISNAEHVKILSNPTFVNAVATAAVAPEQ